MPTQPARVLIIVQNLPVPADRRVWLECRTLVAAGHQVSVICPKAPGDPAHEVLEGVHLFKYKPPPATRSVASFAYEFAYCWVRTLLLSVRVLLSPGFDVIQTCNPPDIYFTLGALYRLGGKRFVYDQHDLCPEVYESRFERPASVLVRLLRLLERLTYRTADHVIVTNESYRRVAIERGGLPSDRVTVVRTGPDDAVMKAGDPDPSLRRGRDHLAVYLGVMGPQDRVDLTVASIDAYVNELGRDDCHFALLGDGDCWNDVRRQVTELGLDDHVTMPGWADTDDVRAYFSTAAVGLSADPHSPLNDVSTMNKTMEYLAFGLPVVAFDLPETMVSAADAAVYVEDDSPTTYATVVADLLDDHERRREMAAAGRERVEEVLAWRHQAPAYLGVYASLSGEESDERSHEPAQALV